MKDMVTGKVWKFGKGSIIQALQVLGEADLLTGHNICNFDIPLLKKLYPWWRYKGVLRDTLCMSKLFDPERLQHSLDSYGKQFKRFKPVHNDWSVFTRKMLHRCSEDVEINHITYNYLVDRECKDHDWLEALELEQLFAKDQALMEVEGVDIDIDKALELLVAIDKEVIEIDAMLVPRLPMKIKPYGVEVKKPFKMDRSYTKMVEDWYAR